MAYGFMDDKSKKNVLALSDINREKTYGGTGKTSVVSNGNLRVTYPTDVTDIRKFISVLGVNVVPTGLIPNNIKVRNIGDGTVVVDVYFFNWTEHVVEFDYDLAYMWYLYINA